MSIPKRRHHPGQHRGTPLRTERQRGIAMLLVLAAVAGVIAIGMAVAGSVPTTVRASANQAIRDAAMYLADSALAEALHRVEHPGAGDAWMTAQDRRIEGLNGTYSYTIVDNNDSTYTITASGRHDTGDQTVTHREVVHVAFEQDTNTFTLDAVAILNGGSPIASGMEYDGDVHFNGNAINLGRIRGDLRATGRVLIAGRVDGNVYRDVNPKPLPSINLDAYQTYSHQGGIYEAERLTAEQLADERGRYDPTSPTNPLGVVIVEDDLVMDDDIRIRNGILVVRGDLDPNGHRLEIEGQPNHMSLLVEGDARFRRSRSEIRVKRGMTFIGDDLEYHRGLQHEVDLREGLILTGTSPLAFVGDFRVRHPDLSDGSGTQQVRYFGEQRGGSGQVTITDLQFVDDSSDG